MKLQPGDSLLHYRILEKLGEGGMGEVWKAVDTTLTRNVAIKVLPETFAADPERLARFEREAKTLAALSHPNIAGIYGLQPATGSGQLGFLAMEYIEGEDLARRLRRGPLPIDEAVAIAGAVAEALSAAHAIGVVHRDLKPANVMLKKDGDGSAASHGTIKVLDFGLAKASAPDTATSGPQGAQSPTVTSFGTAAHVIVGTAAYMAPEQARGRPVDKRADLWALGVLLMEMLTGKPMFAGETVSDTLAAVLKTDPDWTALPPRTPPAVRRLLRRLLEKDPRNRLHDAADARIELARAFDEEAAPQAVESAARGSPRLLAAVAAGALIGGLALGYLLRGPGAVATDRGPVKILSTLEAPPGVVVSVRNMSLAVSPDGQQVAFVGIDGDGRAQLYVRPLDSAEARVLPGTEGASTPFWSPDGRELAFFVGSRLLRTSVAGALPRQIAAVSGEGGTWSPAGVILFGDQGQGAIVRLDVASGEGRPVECTEVETNVSALAPHFLPDGRHFLFQIQDVKGDTSGVYLGELDTTEPRKLVGGFTNGTYADGRLLYVEGDNLMAWPFDLRTLELTGEPARLASSVLRLNYPFHGFFSAAGGTLVYLQGRGALGRSELVWVDRTGGSAEPTGVTGDLYNPRLARDGRRVAVDISTLESHGDIWVFDLARGSSLRLTHDPRDESRPLWMPGESALAFFRVPDLYTINVAGGAEAQPLHASEQAKTTQDITADARWLLFAEAHGGFDLRVLDLQSGQARDWLATPANEPVARFSPDGRWIAYVSDESGRDEVYVDSFPERGERFRVSAEGGSHPVWLPDGRELYYYSASLQVTAVPVDMGSERHPFGPPQPLFATQLRNDFFEVAPDGRRFLLVRQIDVEVTSITLER